MEKISSSQRRVYEIGMVGVIAHNLAKYSLEVVQDCTRDEFLTIVEEYMAFRGVEPEQIDKWLNEAVAQAEREIEFFMMNGRFAESVGGTSIWIGALIGPALDELGYEEVSADV